MSLKLSGTRGLFQHSSQQICSELHLTTITIIHTALSFVPSVGRKCLIEKVTTANVPVAVDLPGQVYSPEQQCQVIEGPGSKLCVVFKSASYFKTNTNIYTYMHTYIHIHIHSYTHTDIYTHIHTHSYTLTHIYIHNTHTHIHTYTLTYI